MRRFRDQPLSSNTTVFLGTAPAGRHIIRPALLTAILLLAAFVITVPWARQPLPAFPVFIPVYNMAVIVLDLVTAVLLLAQLRQLKERAFLALACGYVFTPILVAAHALSFPDAIVKGSLIGGSQTTPWLWMGWHGLFPVFIIAYAAFRKQDEAVPAAERRVSRRTAITAITATIALAIGIVLFTTLNEHRLPELMIGNRYRSFSTPMILSVGWSFHLLALLLLWAFTRLKRLIDAWLAVTLIASLISMALSALLIDARYEVGFYLGRIYGLLAASFVLMVLLREAMLLHGKVVSAMNELRVLQQQKEDFIGIASHELKTPVTSLKVYTELLQEKFEDNGNLADAAMMEKMNVQIDRLTDLIRDLLDTTRITDGQLPLNLEPFDLNTLISERVEEIQRLTVRHHLLFYPDGAGQVTADRERISQVLTNLLSNAVKYSPQGGDVTIKAYATPGGITVSVADKGIGIPEQAKARVFDRFFRVGSSQVRTYPGLGLGLYISSGIIHRHGGHIAVESTEGQGATFSFSIPQLFGDMTEK